MSANTTFHLARLPASVFRGSVDFLRPKLLQKLGLGKTAGPDKLTAPATSFNGEIGSQRGFVYGALPLAEVKAVKKAFGVSVNDVILGLVGSSMRDYLLAHRELPDASLRTSIMVSLRTEHDDSFSNRVTSTSLTLATDVEDPVARLRAINEESGQVKQQAKEGGMGITEIIQLMPPLMVKVMVSASSADMARQMLGANLIVSNVRSSSVPLYIAGAQVEALHPMSIITQGIGINITCVSYADTVGFGVTIDPELVPQPWNIVDGLSTALQEYVALAKKATRQSKAAARKKRPVKKKATGKEKGRYQAQGLSK
jgi:WS/DGAT/MGAT family acyltransferase